MQIASRQSLEASVPFPALGDSMQSRGQVLAIDLCSEYI
jgi:hypothetical protein